MHTLTVLYLHNLVEFLILASVSQACLMFGTAPYEDHSNSALSTVLRPT